MAASSTLAPVEDVLDPSRFEGTLREKTALVTGAGRGIGQAIAVAFARAGCDVACVSRTGSEVEAVASLINSTYPSRARAFVSDVSDLDAIAILVGEVRLWCGGPIHILVNNAGIARIDAIEFQRDLGNWSRILATNLTGPVALTHQLLPDMLAGQCGVIISIGSRNAIYRIPYMSAYSVSKTALLRFHENLEQEVRGKGVYNYYVSSPNVKTSILSTADSVDEESLKRSAGARRMVEMIEKVETSPPGMVADVCVLLAADKDAPVLSGRYIDMDGNLRAVLEDIRKRGGSECVKRNLYRLKMDIL
ncbi:hypothetical protein B0T19DRAFT_231312 [Cercophora scortea]|uniref:Uncharacterized protein n=1 Tax=Cercophora scortea TaxID=314031 RepID=A0AAE0MB14_9PEZI|nr:hypothetical protein B0T19DRAFT_231312 [Cercophora scortea]